MKLKIRAHACVCDQYAVKLFEGTDFLCVRVIQCFSYKTENEEL